MVDLEVYKKDQMNIVLTFKEDGEAIDITGYTIFFTMKSSMDDDDADALIDKTVTTHFTQSGDTLGKSQISLTPTDNDQTPTSSTNKYTFNIMFKTDESTPYTISQGEYIVKQRGRTDNT